MPILSGSRGSSTRSAPWKPPAAVNTGAYRLCCRSSPQAAARLPSGTASVAADESSVGGSDVDHGRIRHRRIQHHHALGPVLEHGTLIERTLVRDLAVVERWRARNQQGAPDAHGARRIARGMGLQALVQQREKLRMPRELGVKWRLRKVELTGAGRDIRYQHGDQIVLVEPT